MANRKRQRRRQRALQPARSVGGAAPVEPKDVPSEQTAAPDASTLRMRDGIGATLMALISAALFATTFSSHVALGDAPESVAGVRSLGILHPPGYPSYVLAGRLFGTILPVGDWALRTNLFSLVCAAVTIGVVYAIARAFGAAEGGAAIGSLALACSASFWFYAGFAKHYPWTALLLALSVLFVVLWQQGGSEWWLVGSALAVAAEVGSGWQLAVIVAFALVVMVTMGERSPSNRALVLTGGALALGVVALGAFVIIRARQDPTLNWGDATNLSRLSKLVGRSDFSGVGNRDTAPFGPRALGELGAIVRDLGLAAMAFAAVGAVAWRRLRREHAVFLGLVIVLNVGAVVIGTGLGRLNGFDSVLSQGGYLGLALIGIAVLTAHGVSVTADKVSEWASARNEDSSKARTTARTVGVVTTVVAAIAVLVPSVIVHRSRADLRTTPLADDYAKRVLAALPKDASLLVWNEEYAMPMIKRQIVDGERKDVSVIAANAVRLDWARGQIERREHLEPGSLTRPTQQLSLVALATELSQRGPVYLDPMAMLVLHNLVGYEPAGVVGKVVAGDVPGPHQTTDLKAKADALDRADRADGLHNIDNSRFVFYTVFFLRARAHLELAKAFALSGDRASALQEIRRGLALLPSNTALRSALAKAERTPRVDDVYTILKDI